MAPVHCTLPPRLACPLSGNLIDTRPLAVHCLRQGEKRERARMPFLLGCHRRKIPEWELDQARGMGALLWH